MKFTAVTCSVKSRKSDGLVAGAFEDNIIDNEIKDIDLALGGYIKRAVKEKLFEGKPGQTLLVDSLGKCKSGKILLIGLGRKDDFTLETLRKGAGKSAKIMRDTGAKNFLTTLAAISTDGFSPALLAQTMAEGMALALYSYNRFKSDKKEKKIETVTLVAHAKAEQTRMSAGLDKAIVLTESACFVRDLVNAPGNLATPAFLADQARVVAREFGIKIKVLNPKAIARLKMGGLMGVAKGSDQPAKFIIMEWMKGPKGQKPIVLVGKGLTFDTGGISLKPSANMEEMKSDMAGGAAMIGAMRAVAGLGLKTNVAALVPATENMPGGSATKPGDVLTGLSGVTMEVINTDAEGRLILSDALAYAERYKPDCIVDIATLTGACMIALGNFASGLFGSDEKLIGQIQKAGEMTGERCWPMPLWPEYEELIKSDVADIKNVGPRWGGAITAAAFLKKHVKGKWAHVDIAGTAFNSKPGDYRTCGASGIGVRLMIEFIENRAGK